MNKPIISVIIPVYNVEKYLSQCLDSILNQTFNDFEVICVNDAANDNSRTILEGYKNKDGRIIVLDKENGGLSSARNAGLKITRGEFICFIDSDDWVRCDMLEKLYENISLFNADISMCGVSLFDETDKTIKCDDSYFNLSVFNKDFDNRIFSYEDTKDFLMDVPVMAWNKLYRKSFLEFCNAEFPDGKIFEDGAFFFSIYFKTKRVSLIREPLYYYRINREGSILKKGGKHLIDIIDIVNLMYGYLKETSIYEDVKYEFYKRKADDITYRYYFLSSRDKRKYRNKLNKESCLLNNKEFDYRYLVRKMPIAIYYKRFCEIRGIQGILDYYIQKFLVRLMYKIMQVLYTEEGIYFFKFWSLKIRIKKYAKIFNVWYAKDKIYILLFNKLKFSFKFEYSKLLL